MNTSDNKRTAAGTARGIRMAQEVVRRARAGLPPTVVVQPRRTRQRQAVQLSLFPVVIPDQSVGGRRGRLTN